MTEKQYTLRVEPTARYKVINGTAYDARTPDDLCAVLETVRATRERCVFVCGDVETGVPWDDKPERGTIGRSTGTYRIPLLIKTRRSLGGGGLLDHCILQVRTTVGGRTLYRRSVAEVRMSHEVADSGDPEAPYLGAHERGEE